MTIGTRRQAIPGRRATQRPSDAELKAAIAYAGGRLSADELRQRVGAPELENITAFCYVTLYAAAKYGMLREKSPVELVPKS